jgi:hypothetical protein
LSSRSLSRSLPLSHVGFTSPDRSNWDTSIDSDIDLSQWICSSGVFGAFSGRFVVACMLYACLTYIYIYKYIYMYVYARFIIIHASNHPIDLIGLNRSILTHPDISGSISIDLDPPRWIYSSGPSCALVLHLFADRRRSPT